MNPLGHFVYLRTYSRWLPEQGRRETWKETVRRATEYNVSLGVKHMDRIGYGADIEWHRKEAELLFDNMFHLRQFLSGRTLWVGGAENGVAEKYPLSNFNCSFLNIASWSDLGDMFYLLMVGTGTGFKCTKEMAANLAPIRTNTALLHSEYEPVPKAARYERTQLRDMANGYAKIYVGDSKEGWVESLRVYLDILTKREHEHIHTVKISYNSVRPNGERLNTFGGTASGPEPLREMFAGIDRVLKNEIDPGLAPLEDVMVPFDHKPTGLTLQQANPRGYQRVRPIHILDIGNLIGNNVVVGGVRRTAEIFLMDADDYECIFAKYGFNGIWDADKHARVIEKTRALGLEKEARFLEGLPTFDPNARPLHHRRMSNNSIAFTEQPSREFLNLVFTMMQAEGEPGFVNLEEARRRRPNAEGLNPCAEILLDSYGVCNLTTVNMTAFDVTTEYGMDALERAQRLSARCGMRMTLAELEIPHWNTIQQRDRLLGTSLTGVKDAFATYGLDDEG
ncbi:ribonucleoside-triphosphate reductase, adenosylcobalamin-dependent, partial [Paenibacillus polymyxa]|uniref:ribonucleoside-triphosphate reductase, adenosylcobalamin-dependent n=1 Tax=Paenibacillus polymyxa TaxID=1406 RepID=UPI0010715FE0